MKTVLNYAPLIYLFIINEATMKEMGLTLITNELVTRVNIRGHLKYLTQVQFPEVANVDVMSYSVTNVVRTTFILPVIFFSLILFGQNTEI